MPNRILRGDILTSDRVARLSWAGEVFYRRLMSAVDDFGRFDGRLSVLRGTLYPLQIDKVTERDVGKWRQESVDAGLVTLYAVDGKEYLCLLRFNQQVRAKLSKYPSPPSETACAADATQMLADAQHVLSTRAASAHLDGDGDVCGVGDEGGVAISSEPPKTSDSKLVTNFVFPCVGPTREWALPVDLYDQLGQWYLGVDRDAELRKAIAWCTTNGSRRKTAKGMPAFLTGWFQRQQNSGLGATPVRHAARSLNFQGLQDFVNGGNDDQN